VSQKLKNEQLRAAESRKLWGKFVDNLSHKPDDTMEESKRKRLYLQMIAHINGLGETLKTIIEIKNKVNNNHGKTTVIKSLVYGIERPRDMPMSSSQLLQEEEELEEKVREAEEQK
jgi:hypothetical protein